MKSPIKDKKIKCTSCDNQKLVSQDVIRYTCWECVLESVDSLKKKDDV